MKLKIAAIAILMLAGCDDGKPAQNVKKIEVTDGGASLQRLRGLTQQNRDLALRRAIQDSGQKCKRIQSSSETGTYKNMATWTARCEGGTDWGIFIAPAGDIQVRSCAHLEKLGLPGCKPNEPVL